MSIDLKSVIAHRAIESGGRLRVQSALNPALWLCGIISVPSLMVAGYSANPPPWIIWLVIGPVLVASAGFIFLLLVDRDKLQSEDYQLRKKSLELIEQKGMNGPIIDETAVIISPQEIALTDAEDEQ